MTDVKVSERAEERRTRVLQAAHVLFAKHGFHATSTAQIEQASGVKIAQVYRDFGSKETIVALVARASVEACFDTAGLDRAIAANDRAALRNWVYRCGAVSQVSSDTLMTEIFAEAGRNPAIGFVALDMVQTVREQLDRALLALAPKAAKGRRDELADMVVVVALGSMAKRGFIPAGERAVSRTNIVALIDREIDSLSGAAEADLPDPR